MAKLSPFEVPADVSMVQTFTTCASQDLQQNKKKKIKKTEQINKQKIQTNLCDLRKRYGLSSAQKVFS